MDRYETEDSVEVKKLIKILVILVLIILAVYFFTRIFVTKDLLNKDNKTETVTEGKLDYTKTMIGAMLTRKESDYYVLIYDMDTIEAVTYSGIASKYASKEDALTVYFADLGSELNKNYKAESASEVSLSSLDNFKVYDVALIKVSNGKIVKSLSNVDAIAEELK